MKEKTLEKIPYITVPQKKRGKGIKYVAVSAIADVKGESYLLLEVYQNKKSCLNIPVLRYACTRKDYGCYYPDSGLWYREKIENYINDKLRWQQAGDSKYRQDRRRENVLFSPDDLQRIKDFFPDITIYTDDDWWDYFDYNERGIKYEATSRRYKRRQDALKDRCQNTPPLQTQELLKWADIHLFHEKHFLYYKKHGRHAKVCCSKCGGVADGAWKSGISYESQLERWIEEPREGQIGTCTLCGARGIYKPKGKVKFSWTEKADTFVFDRYKETGAVVRYVRIEKAWVLEERAEASGLEMQGAYEKLLGVEIARTFFEAGKKPHTDFQKDNPYQGGDFWDDCNLSGIANIGVYAAKLYSPSLQNLDDTILQYSAIGLYVEEVGKVNARGYMERYLQYPQIEMLVKLKLYNIVASMCNYHPGIIRDDTANRPDTFLGIRKEHLPLLQRWKGSTYLLDVLKREKNLGAEWTDRQCEAFAVMDISNDGFRVALQYMSAQKLLNRIERYAGCQYSPDLCGHGTARLKTTATTYFDYLAMRQQRGYDLHNTVYQCPRDLQAAHNAMVDEIDREKTDQRKQEAAEKFPLIRKNYRKLRKQYFYEDEKYLIRPARSAEEIIDEGRMLHHCVGGNNYLTRHNEQKSIILMLRMQTKPEQPYITVEIRENHIMQWYGAHDKKPDEENMQRWLDRYILMLKCGEVGADQAEEQEDTQEIGQETGQGQQTGQAMTA